MAFLAMSSTAMEYERLIEKRHQTPCTPEEQAGPDASKCKACGRMTLHQHTGEPMCGCQPNGDEERQ